MAKPPAKPQLKPGFYWLCYKGRWTIGEYTPYNPDGSVNTHPIDIVGSDDIFRVEDFVWGPRIDEISAQKDGKA